MSVEFQHGQFSWVDLNSHSMANAKQFYGQFFGWQAEDQETEGGYPYSIFSLEGKQVAGLGEMSEEMKAQGIPPMWNSYVNVDEIQPVFDKAVEMGATPIAPPMQVLDAGWLAFFQDPGGAMIALWQKNQHAGAQQVNDPGCFCWNELATRDLEQAKDFYGNLFGWTFDVNEEGPAPYLMIKNNGADNGGMMQMTEEWGEIPPFWGVYFTVPNAEEACQKITALGGKVCHGPFEISIGKIAMVNDQQGAFFSLFEFAKQPA